MKVDTSRIDGYDAMTAEEKVAALENHEVEVGQPAGADTEEVGRLKAALNKSTKEAADYKRALRERQTEEERKAAADADERRALLERVEALQAEKTISDHKAAYLSLGYDEKSAADNAKALYNGDFATVFANHKKFIDEQKRSATASALDSQPSITPGDPLTQKDVGDAFTTAFRRNIGLPQK